MPRVEHIRRSHGASEYTIILTEDEMDSLDTALRAVAASIANLAVVPHPIWPQLSNAIHLLDSEKFPTPF
jgi:hypothetical protein